MNLEVKKRSPQTYFIRTIAAIGLVASFTLFIDHINNNLENNNNPRFAENTHIPDALPEVEKEQFVVEVNKQVTVAGTGNDGLRLRDDAGLNAPVISYAWDGESFTTTGQSLASDGYLWYQIRDEFGNIYWAASNWLK